MIAHGGLGIEEEKKKEGKIGLFAEHPLGNRPKERRATSLPPSVRDLFVKSAGRIPVWLWGRD